jgi:hypothetical protein
LRHFNFAAELALEDDGVVVPQVATPASGGGGGGGGGVAFGQEVVGGCTNFGNVVDVGVLREGITEVGKRGSV